MPAGALDAVAAGVAAVRACSAGGAAAALMLGIEAEGIGVGDAVGAAGRVAAGCVIGAGGFAAGIAAAGRGDIGVGGDMAGFAASTGFAAVAGSVFLLMAFSTSPGFEILERSIFGLISSAAARERFSAAAPPSALAKCLRTRSIKSPSSELEWLLLSSTPMVGR